jgi:hypothetical protein
MFLELNKAEKADTAKHRGITGVGSIYCRMTFCLLLLS